MISLLNSYTRHFKHLNDEEKADFRKIAKSRGYIIQPGDYTTIKIMNKDRFVCEFDGSNTPEESVLALIAEDMILNGGAYATE